MMRKLGTVLLAAAFPLAAGCADGERRVPIRDLPPRPPAITIQGYVTVPADSVNSQDFKGGDCTGAGGYGDIVGGSQVRITTASGAIIRIGKLNSGHTSALFSDPGSIIDGKASQCSYHFQVEGVNGELDTYGVSVGNISRGIVYYTRDQLREPLEIGLAG